MRPSSGVLYLLLALNMASTAPVPPLARRSIRIEVHYVDVNGDQRDANQAVDTFYNSINALINGDVPTTTDEAVLRTDMTGSGNDDTADVTSPGPGDADPGGASTNSVTLP
ncbi:uncharacterized protein LOC118407658 isoform X1 [Branchiostoma floridae]|uniref:Uncharacterized protein LOC118407658 isoform X1 n=1 Tax=Branchiostoma floridae TaxID=7739 RepID=A0A9J7HRC1_BRAFL|nr:uncharacterized protein LOC118407658 isoform X1 [Branchiostoma floridae]